MEFLLKKIKSNKSTHTHTPSPPNANDKQGVKKMPF